MAKKISVIDTTIRDGQQSLWATRMTTASMLPMIEPMDRCGFQTIDVFAHVQIDAMIRFLKENPWERARLIRQRVKNTPLRTAMRAKGFSFTDPMPQDLIDLWIDRLLATGFEEITVFDGLNDFDNLEPLIHQSKKLGARVICALTYSVSPFHTDSMYVDLARRLAAETKVDAFMIKDSGGLLTPDRIRTLVPAIKSVSGDIPVELHTHSPTGLGLLVYLEGANLGVDAIHTSIAPLANGVAQPSIQTTAHNLQGSIDINRDAVDEVSRYLQTVAEAEGKSVGQVLEYDVHHYTHQAPGGMITNFKTSLAEAGLSDRLDEVLEECIRVRSEIGWPMMITPFAQIIGTQALMNVLRKERYAVVPDVLKKYVLGYFGRATGPVDQDVLDKIINTGSQAIALTPPIPEPGVPGLRKRYPNMSDEERLLRHMFPGNQVDQMLAAPPINEHYSVQKPVVRLLSELLRRSELGHICVEHDNDRMEIYR